MNRLVDEALAEVWLSDLGSTTWGGRGWDVTDPKERREAAQWFIGEVYKLSEFMTGLEAELEAEGVDTTDSRIHGIGEREAGVGSDPSEPATPVVLGDYR